MYLASKIEKLAKDRVDDRIERDSFNNLIRVIVISHERKRKVEKLACHSYPRGMRVNRTKNDRGLFVKGGERETNDGDGRGTRGSRARCTRPSS